jgi:hypothetical protein
LLPRNSKSIVKLGTLNSRLKDYFDVWALSRQFDFEGEVLSEAIAKTFSNRGTEIISDPVGLTARFAADPEKNAQGRVCPKDTEAWLAELRRVPMPR